MCEIGCEKILKDAIDLSARNRQLHLEMMAAAFLNETGLPASECELVVQNRLEGTCFHYRKRQQVAWDNFSSPLDDVLTLIDGPARGWVILLDCPMQEHVWLY